MNRHGRHKHSKWNCVGANRPQHMHHLQPHGVCDLTLNTPKIRIVQKKNSATTKFEFESANYFQKLPKSFELVSNGMVPEVLSSKYSGCMEQARLATRTLHSLSRAQASCHCPRGTHYALMSLSLLEKNTSCPMSFISDTAIKALRVRHSRIHVPVF